MSEAEKPVQQPLGECPACGGEIIEGKKGFGCKNWREQDGGCRFVVWKEIAGQRITPETLHTLLSGGMTQALSFRSKEGKEFSASLKVEWDEEQGRWQTRFVSSVQNMGIPHNTGGSPSEGPAVLGQCPVCGGDVVEGRKGYGCKNWRQEGGACRFVIWKEIAGKQIPLADVKRLLEKGETGIIHGFMSKKGKEFSARLKVDGKDFKTSFVF